MLVFITKDQMNVKKQMINYRASLQTQVYLRSPDRRAGKEEKKDRTYLVSETTTTSSSPVLYSLDRTGL
jgi:hypothetical protein